VVKNTVIGRVICEIGQRCFWALRAVVVHPREANARPLSGFGEEAGDIKDPADARRSNPTQPDAGRGYQAANGRSGRGFLASQNREC